jgi:hypothetical protein
MRLLREIRSIRIPRTNRGIHALGLAIMNQTDWNDIETGIVPTDTVAAPVAEDSQQKEIERQALEQKQYDQAALERSWREDKIINAVGAVIVGIVIALAILWPGEVAFWILMIPIFLLLLLFSMAGPY